MTKDYNVSYEYNDFYGLLCLQHVFAKEKYGLLNFCF